MRKEGTKKISNPQITTIEELDALAANIGFPFYYIVAVVYCVLETIICIAKSDYLDRWAIRQAYKSALWKYPSYASRLFHACYTLLQRRLYFLIVSFIFLGLWIDIQRQFLWPLLWNSQTGALYIDPLSWSDHGFILFGTTMQVMIYVMYLTAAFWFTSATTIAGAMFVPVVAEIALQFGNFPSKKKLLNVITLAYANSQRSNVRQEGE